VERREGIAGGWPTVYLYDTVPGGIGFAEHLFGEQAGLLAAARGLVDGCGCRAGCPSCVGPPSASVDARRSTRALIDIAVASCRGKAVIPPLGAPAPRA
jgi:DEAD/DEAH box helicase domain-containing protein